MDQMKITTILIDVDNTLLDFNKCALGAVKEVFVKYKLDYKDYVFEVFQEENDRLWEAYEKGEIKKNDIFDRRWKQIFKRLRIEEDGKKAETHFIESIRDSHEPVEGAMDVLKYLSGKYNIYVASNSQYEQQMNRLTNAGMMPYISQLFISDRMGAAKPSIQFFDGCFQKIGEVLKEEVIIIGDSISADIGGGRAYGIRTCWYNHNKIAAEVEADYTIDKLEDIIHIL